MPTGLFKSRPKNATIIYHFFCPHSELIPMFKTTIGPETSYEVLWLYWPFLLRQYPDSLLCLAWFPLPLSPKNCLRCVLASPTHKQAREQAHLRLADDELSLFWLSLLCLVNMPYKWLGRIGTYTNWAPKYLACCNWYPQYLHHLWNHQRAGCRWPERGRHS